MASDWGKYDKKVGRVGTERGAPRVLGEVEGDPRASEPWGGERGSLILHSLLVALASAEGDN